MTTKKPWAILICKFTDQQGDDPTLRDKDIFKKFFTPAGAGSFNAVKYFDDMSHGQVDISGSTIFSINLPVDSSTVQDSNFIRMVRVTAKKSGVPLDDFYADVITSTKKSMPTHGQVLDGRGWAIADFRYVQDNGTQSWGHEMGHGFGYDHSRCDKENYNPCNCVDGPPDYRDPWDIMSAACDYSTKDLSYTAKGPGMNAWNMRSKNWLDESRVWKNNQGFFHQVVELRPLHRRDLPGFLAAELPSANNQSKYLVEFRVKEQWDEGIPEPIVLIHRFENNQSYLVLNTKGEPSFAAGDEFNPGNGANPFPKAKVVSINAINHTATIEIAFLPKFIPATDMVIGKNADSRLEVFLLGNDKSVYHKWQITPNGGWSNWDMLWGSNIRQIKVAKNADGRLELFAVGGDRAVYHTWQTIPNGGWSAWASLAGKDIQQISIEKNADGRLELFALGGDRIVYHIWQTTPNGNWGAWASLAGSNIQQITTNSNADGRLELFAIGGDNAVYHIWQTTLNGNWGAWASLAGKGIKQIITGKNSDGRIELFAIGSDKVIYHIWQTIPNGNWGAWASLAGHDLQQIAAGRNADGRLELFALGSDKSVYHIWQTIPNGNWGAWAPLAGRNIQQISVAQNADGRLELFAMGGDNLPYHIWQIIPNGNWGQWAGL